jgi:hypothetical protein
MDPENGSSAILQNVGKYLLAGKALYSRRDGTFSKESLYIVTLEQNTNLHCNKT